MVSLKQHLTPVELREYNEATDVLRDYKAQVKAWTGVVRRLKDVARKRAEKNRGAN